MAVVTIRPDSIWNNTGNAANNAAKVADASDATYDDFPTLPTGPGQAYFGFANLSLPVGAQIRSVQLKYRHQIPSGTTLTSSRLYTRWPTGPYIAISYLAKSDTTIRTFSSAVLVKNPDGKAWTQADVNGLAFWISVGGTGRIMDIWVDVVYDMAPTVTVSAPTGSYTTSVRPTIQWSYSDPENEPQELYRVKVFTAAQYGIPAFDPEKSPYTWDSGQVRSDNPGARVTVNLGNGVTYRAYVKASDKGSNGRWSAWAYSQFTVNVPIPAAPTLAADGLANTDVKLSLGGLVAGNFATVERNDTPSAAADAKVWTPVRGSYGWVAMSGAQQFYDYEAPTNKPCEYRAFQWYQDEFGNVFGSPMSIPVTITVPNNVTRLKDTGTPGRQLKLSLRDNFKVSRPRGEGVFRPLGSAVAVVLVDAQPGGEEIPLPLQFKTDADYQTFKAIRESGAVCLLLTDGTDQWYVQLVGDAEIETQMSAVRKLRPYRTTDMTAVAVARPVDLTPQPGTT